MLRFLPLSVVVLAGCTIFGPDSPADIESPATLQGEFFISGGSSFGECLGYCRHVLTLSEEGMTLDRMGTSDRQFPDFRYERPLSDREWRGYRALADERAILALHDVYGCPDCADGGAEWIEIRTDSLLKRVTFEFGETIPEIEPLIERLRAIREEWISSIQ